MTTIRVSPAPIYMGLSFIALLAITSYALTGLPLFTAIGINSLIVAIIAGILIGNTWQHPTTLTPGIQFAAKRILRLAIILYGFRVNFQQIYSIGPTAIFIDMFVVSITLILGYFAGKKLFKLDAELALLISAGAAICGAAAVLAVEDILKSDAYKTAIAIGTVVLFGTTSMFLYPMLQHEGFFGFSAHQFGIFAGASIHEVAQALVAGANIGSDTGQIAVIVKMIRVLLLVPVLIVLSLIQNQRASQTANKSIRFTVPWFAIGFIAMIAFNSLGLLPSNVVDAINQLDVLLLTMAMGAIGVETKMSKMKLVGLKPLYLALMLFFWLMGSVALLVKLT
ncbi:MAG: hypothetical protein A3E84_00445 [Gammaproteobacteria bacterium RIFCSPHIGHO2_12_FULL_42_13]|nr:MAG: hypothetical protein A3E84_00445 [Gammaproteobacteria bacterium RIFCSPHIGHO2_12_FULL_42_13]